MFQLDLKSRKSIYEQVVDNTKELIISGVLTTEDKLPSVRELSKTLTVNPNTVQKAYRELEHQGYIYSVSGLGTFVSAPPEMEPDAKKIEELKSRILEHLKELIYLGMTLDSVKLLVNDIFEERSNWQ